MSLLTDLAAYWTLDDDTWADAVGSLDLTGVNSPTVGAGIIDGCVSLNGSNQYLHRADDADLRGGDGSWTVAGWFYAESWAYGVNILAAKLDGSTMDGDYRLKVDGGGGSGDFLNFDCGGFTLSTDAPSAGAWHHVVFGHDADTSTLFLAVDGGTPLTQDTTLVTLPTTSTPFYLGGADVSGSPGAMLEGDIDEVGVWRRALTPDEIATLYNGGDGLTYPFGESPPTADFSGTPLSGVTPLSVAFTDASTNTPTSWLWEKNSGSGWVSFSSGSTLQNPIESFTTGTWSVRLTATNAHGSDTKTRTNYIVVTSPSTPSAPVSDGKSF